MGYAVQQFGEFSRAQRSFQMNFDSGLFGKWHGSLERVLHCDKVLIRTNGRGIYEGNNDTIHADSTALAQDARPVVQPFSKLWRPAADQRFIHEIVGTHGTNADSG